MRKKFRCSVCHDSSSPNQRKLQTRKEWCIHRALVDDFTPTITLGKTVLGVMLTQEASTKESDRVWRNQKHPPELERAHHRILNFGFCQFCVAQIILPAPLPPPVATQLSKQSFRVFLLYNKRKLASEPCAIMLFELHECRWKSVLPCGQHRRKDRSSLWPASWLWRSTSEGLGFTSIAATKWDIMCCRAIQQRSSSTLLLHPVDAAVLGQRSRFYSSRG